MDTRHGSWVDASTIDDDSLNDSDELISGRFQALIQRIEASTSTRGGRFLQQLSLRLALLWVSFSIALTMTRFAANAILRRLR
jgi:hypothetical protein